MDFCSEDIKVNVDEEMRQKRFPFCDVNNEELVYAFYEPEDLAAKIAVLDAEARALCKIFLQKRHLMHRLEQIQLTAKRITLDHNGVMIYKDIINDKEGNERYEFRPVANKWDHYNWGVFPEYPRTAIVYRNAHNNTTWGLHLDVLDKTPPGGRTSHYQGAHHTDPEKLIQEALDWVAIRH